VTRTRAIWWLRGLVALVTVAIVVARLVPSDWRGAMAPVVRGAVRCGENSLEIYCVSVLLSLVAHLTLLRISGGIAAQAFVSAAGILLLTGLATLSTWISIGSRREPRLF